MFNPFGSKQRELPDGYVEITINPKQIWKPSLNMIYWPTLTRVYSYLEMHKFPVSQQDNTVLIETDFGRFEIHIEEKMTVGRGANRVAIVMGPFSAVMPPEIHNLKQEIADLFVKGKKINWRGPEDMRGWWEE